jgi:methyl-accepting chemotaxis protein
MRLIKFLLPLGRLTRLLTSFSVRTRIIVLALIPVVGFLANGLTYVAGEGEVATAFQTVNRSVALADASRNFKSAVSDMRFIAKDFSAKPGDELVQKFEKAHSAALQNLEFLKSAIDGGHAENIVRLDKDVAGLHSTFTKLVAEQKTLGFDDSSGLQRNLSLSGNAVERIINENTTWRRYRSQEIDDDSADHAALRSRISAQPTRFDTSAIQHRLHTIHRYIRLDRWHAGDEVSA